MVCVTDTMYGFEPAGTVRTRTEGWRSGAPRKWRPEARRPAPVHGPGEPDVSTPFVGTETSIYARMCEEGNHAVRVQVKTEVRFISESR